LLLEINIETDVPVVPDMKAKINECVKEKNYREAILIIMKCDFMLEIKEPSVFIKFYNQIVVINPFFLFLIVGMICPSIKNLYTYLLC